MFTKLLAYKKEDSLIRDSFILFIATMIANVLGYFYHFYMGRVLGPADYGVLGFFFALLYWVNIPALALQTTITRLVSSSKVNNDHSRLSSLYTASTRPLFKISVAFLFVFLLLIPFGSSFFQIPTSALLFFSPLLLFALVLPFNRGILQGLQSFHQLGTNTILEGVVKLSMGILLVLGGLRVGGAMFAVTLSFFISYLHSYFVVKKHVEKTSSSRPVFFSLLTSAWPILLTLSFLTAFYTVDLFLVKRFFPAVDAGYYAALSLLGRTIFFGTFSITTVMFPKVAAMEALKKANNHILYKSLGFMGIGAFFAVTAFYLFPDLVVSLLFGKAYLSISPYVWQFGLVMALFSFCYLLSFYNLSIQRRKFVWILFLFNLFEIFLILEYHSSLAQVIHNLLMLMAVLFAVLVVYTLRRKQSYEA
ncbi:oligosaccharide flippase family protein [Candidatus Woesearchaeota archaeon]|nr:oligosaccharide flippase family protein [Candidatus Woesearchaeota archaeon]